MKVLAPIKEFILSLERRQWWYYFAAYIGIVLLFMVVSIYWFYSSMSDLEQRMKNVNRARAKTQTILQKYELVRQQQDEVAAILAKEKGFKIGEYFAAVSNDLGLARFATKPAEVSEPQDVTADYEEVKLDASFNDINMKQLVDLLYTIEQKERISTKELVISKAKNRTLDVTLVIATLQPKGTTA